VIIKSFSSKKENVHSRNIDLNSFKKEDPILIIPRKNQIEIMENHYNSNYFQLTQPPGSGKSTIIAYVMSKKLLENPNLKVIVIVPQTNISKTFGRMVFNHDGKYIEWDCYHDLCKSVTFSKVKYLVNFLKNKDILTDINSRIALTTHASFARAVEKLQDSDNSIFENIMVVIDEAHHTMYEDNATSNKIGNFIKRVFNNKLNTGIWLATATPYRSDNNNMIPKEIQSQFDKHFLPLDKHWEDNIKHINSFSFNFVIYKQDQIINQVKEVFKLGKKKSIIFCPYVGHLMNNSDKHIFKTNLIDAIKEVWPECKILDLIEVDGRNKRKEILEDNKTSKNVDVILTLKIFDEGSDWVHAQQCLDLSPSNYLRVMYQRFGRLWRDYIGKNIIEYFCFLPFEAKFKDEDERRLHLSKSFNALSAALLLQDIIQPIKYPSTLKGKHKKVNPFQQAFPDEDKRSDMLEKVIKKLLVMKSVSENPSAQDVKQWIKCALTSENIVENQDEIVNYIGLIFRRMSNQNHSKKPDWSNAFDIEKLIEGGFDKIWVNDVFENLRVFGTNICTAETFKEFREIISGKYTNVDEYVKEVENMINPITGLAPPISTFSPGCQFMVRKYPDKFKHIKFKKPHITVDEHLLYVEKTVDPITGLAPPISTFSPGCRAMIRKYPDKFEHIKFKKPHITVDEHVLYVEKTVDPITGLAPPISTFSTGCQAIVLRYPDKFEHIKFKKNRKTIEYHIKQIQKTVDPITGLAPPISTFSLNQQSIIRKHREKFKNIKFEKLRENVDDYIKKVQKTVDPITGLAPPKCTFGKKFYTILNRHPKKFSHIQFENGQETRKKKNVNKSNI
jgi:superfamily II DNA or RNA helicase